MGGCGSSGNSANASMADVKSELHSMSNLNLHKAGTLLDMDDMNKKTQVEAANVAETLTHLGHVCLSQHKFSDSRNFYERALKIYEKALDEKHISPAETRQQLAKCLFEYGRYEDGLRFWIGVSPNAEKKYAEAVQLLETALPIFEEVHGQQDVLTAKLYADYAMLLTATSKLAEADDYFQRALTIIDKSLTFNTQVSPRGIECTYTVEDEMKNDFSLAGGNGMEITVFDLKKGGSLERAGVKVGMELFEVSEGNARRKVSSANDIENLLESLHVPATLHFRQMLYSDARNVLTQWGISLKESEKFDRARKNFEKALEISRFVDGEKSLIYANIEKEYGHCLQKEGRFEEGYQKYSSAFRFHEKTAEKIIKELDVKMGGIRGKTSVDERLATPTFLMLGLAQTLLGSVRAEEARTFGERAVKFCTKCYGQDHAAVAYAKNICGCALYLLKRYEEAATVFKDANKIYSIAIDANHPAAIHCLVNRACCLARHKPGVGIDAATEGVGEAHAEALEILEQALQQYKDAQVGDHICVATVLCNKAYILYRKGKFAEAATLQNRAREMREASLPYGHVLQGVALLNGSDASLQAQETAEAMTKAESANLILKEELGPDHECVASCNMASGRAALALNRPSDAFEHFSVARGIRAAGMDAAPRRLLLHECARLHRGAGGQSETTRASWWVKNVDNEVKDGTSSHGSDTEKMTEPEDTVTDPDPDPGLVEIKEGDDDDESQAEGGVVPGTSVQSSPSAGKVTASSKVPNTVNTNNTAVPAGNADPPLAGAPDTGKGINPDSIRLEERKRDADEISYCSSSMTYDESDPKRRGMAGRVTLEFENIHMRECVGVCAEWTDVPSARDVFVKVNIEVLPNNHVGKQGVSEPLHASRRPFCILLQQGACSFVEKALCASEVGAIGFVVLRKDKGKPFVMSHTSVNAEAPQVPGIMVSQEAGEALYGACMAQKEPKISRLVKGISAASKESNQNTT